jgi:transcriptional regulator with XRE-family HTH domain
MPAVVKSQRENGKEGREMDQAKLRGLIREKYGTQEAFARDMGISDCSVSKKLNGHSEWGADEIRRACELLGIKSEDIPLYFFTPKVGKTQF